MRYCKGCGTQLPEGAVFCPSCGRKVESDTQGAQNNGSTRNFNTEYCQNENNYQRSNTYYDRNDSYSPLTILGLVFAFVAALVGLILSILANNEAKRTGSQKNLSLSKTGITLSAVFLGLEVFAVVIVVIIVIIIACGAALAI